MKIPSVLLCTLVLFSLPSCSFFSEPEPVVNTSFHAASTTATGMIRPYTAGQKVTGAIQVEFVPDLPRAQIYKIDLVLDEKDSLGALKDPPYIYSINTLARSAGVHKLVFDLYLSGDNLGLMQVPEAPPSQRYTTSLEFDPSPPTVPANLRAAFHGGVLTVSWDPSPDATFKHYEFYRRIEYPGSLIAEDRWMLEDRSRTSFAAGIFDCGVRVSFVVGASNNVDTTYADTLRATFDRPIDIAGVVGSTPLESQALIVLPDSSLAGAKIVNGQLVVAPLNARGPVGPTMDGDSFVVSEGGQLRFFSRTTLQQISVAAAPPDIGSSFFIGPGGRLFVSAGMQLLTPDTALNLKPVSGLWLAGSLRHFFPMPDGHSVIAEDGYNLVRLSLLGDSATITATKWLDGSADGLLGVDWASNTIYGRGKAGAIVVRDAATFESVGSVAAPDPGVSGFAMGDVSPQPHLGYMVDLKVTSSALYATYLIQNLYDWIVRAVAVRYDRSTLHETGRWYLPASATDASPVVVVSRDDLTRFISTSSGHWLLEE